MNLHPSLLHLEPADVARRERAVQHIGTMRATLDTLTHYIEHASAEALCGNYWCELVENAELSVRAALRATTCEGHARIGRMEFAGHG